MSLITSLSLGHLYEFSIYKTKLPDLFKTKSFLLSAGGVFVNGNMFDRAFEVVKKGNGQSKILFVVKKILTTK